MCGALDPGLALGSLIVFDDLHFPVNRLPDGSLCTLHTEPGAPGRGHWIFDRPFAQRALRAALIAAAREQGAPYATAAATATSTARASTRARRSACSGRPA